MLLAILLIFLITEFPSGILGLLTAICGSEFYSNVYQPLGEILDILALINSAINFILYCTMSRLFRVTFVKLFCQMRTLRIGQQQDELNDNRARRTSLTVALTELPTCRVTTCL